MNRVLRYVALVAAILCGVFLFFWIVTPGTTIPTHIEEVQIREGLVKVEVVDTPATRERGLSGRPSLAKNEGMLFIFPIEDVYPFWMKDMLFPIDIIWISKERVVVDIVPDLSPDTYPTAFSPHGSALYVLETAAGFAKEHSIQVGDRVLFK